MLPSFTDGAGRGRRALAGWTDAVAGRLDTVAERLAVVGWLDAAGWLNVAGWRDTVAGWLDAAVEGLNAIRLAVDDVRVREHLRRTERALRATDHDHLSADQRRRRERALDRLREYRQAGEFPRNERTAGRSPVFVGAEGTHCALGHLLAEDGREDLVAEVMAADPLVYVEDLGDGALVDGAPGGGSVETALLEWVAAQGLTREEAARIQPGYAHAVHFATTCGPVPCWLAGALASLVGLGTMAASEYLGYRLVDDLFPDNALKRRGALGYVTLMNLFLGAFVAALVYALFP